MVDLSFIGKGGLIIDYEDIISMIGFNILRYFHSKKLNEKVERMSVEDILLNYINRQTEDIVKYIKDEYNIEVCMGDFKESVTALEPNLLYSFNLFDYAYKNGIKDLYVYNEFESDMINKFLTTYTVPVKLLTGDIRDVIKTHLNFTYTTASDKRIRKILGLKVPFALSIVDDFMYTAPILIDKIGDKLREENVFVNYTGVFSAGLT